jgi:hypothetical protein
MPTLEEFRKRQAEKGGSVADRRAALESERRAQSFVSIRMEDLLASDDWGIYRKHLEVIRESHASRAADLEAQILGPALGEELVKLKLDRAALNGVVVGLTFALAMPDQLRAQAAAIEARLVGQLDTPADSR